MDEDRHLLQININDIEKNDIRLIINGAEYLVKIVKNETVKIYGSTYIVNDEILKAIERLPLGKNKNGDGRKATEIARQFQISVSTVYQARKILKKCPDNIIKDVRSGKMAIKTAYKLITSKKPNEKSQRKPKEKK